MSRGVCLRPGGQPRARAGQRVGRGRGSGAHVGHDGVAGDLVRSLGADHVVDYTRTDFTGTEKRYDVIHDNVRTYPLDEAADALRYVGAGHTRGKVVVTV